MSDTTAPKTPAGEDGKPVASDNSVPAEKQFQPPASQADMDRIIADRLARERQKYADYDELKTKAAKFDAAQEAAKSEQQKQAEALQAAQAKLAEYEAEKQVRAWVDEVAETAKLSPEQKAVLKGSTKEELEAHAELIKSLTPTPPPAPFVVPTVGQTPTPSGNVPIGQQIAAAEKAGQWELVAQLKAIQLGAVSAS